eukprot:gene9678-1889_t
MTLVVVIICVECSGDVGWLPSTCSSDYAGQVHRWRKRKIAEDIHINDVRPELHPSG